MPTVRKRITRNPIKDIEPWKIEFLKFGEISFEGLTEKEISHIEWGYLSDFFFEEVRKPTWNEIRSEIMPQWISEHPCTRPWGWWEHDSPAQGELENSDPRQQVGSKGEVCRYCYAPHYKWGVFEYWHYDENSPPIFESEAAYLQRLDLLTDKEKKHLSANPKLLEPVPINEIGHFRPERRISLSS
jgi:hypothetical protein